MTYTNINKPNSTSYTNTNTVGKQQYDQVDITYDDSSVFFDGVNFGAYTNITKPQIQYALTQRGIANGLMIPLTTASVIGSVEISPYTNISKPI